MVASDDVVAFVGRSERDELARPRIVRGLASEPVHHVERTLGVVIDAVFRDVLQENEFADIGGRAARDITPHPLGDARGIERATGRRRAVVRGDGTGGRDLRRERALTKIVCSRPRSSANTSASRRS